MNNTIIDYARELAVKRLFEQSGFNTSWDIWKNEINSRISTGNEAKSIYNLGDTLRDIFRSTNVPGRTQDTVSSGGASWEALICWYLNLCTFGTRTVVIKHNKNLIPQTIADAITVNYGNRPSNTESDLIAITFPDKSEYSIDKDDIQVPSESDPEILLETRIGKTNRYNYQAILDTLVQRDFNKIEIHIIQCKTNWNDNAQIPMLWDAIYNADSFRNNITIGKGTYSVKNAAEFSYSFVTVPSNKIEKNGKPVFKPESTSVLRVANLSGGNYWGLESVPGVANSVKELITRKLNGGINIPLVNNLSNILTERRSELEYFNIL